VRFGFVATAIGRNPVPLLEKHDKARLFKMVVGGQCLAEFKIVHDHEDVAISSSTYSVVTTGP
jgi:hypothetical protein